jgi:SAM-dependent methyltransferase
MLSNPSVTYRIADLVVCPGCRSTQLERGNFIDSPSPAPDYLRCLPCGRFYFVVDGILRMVTEAFPSLVAADWALERQATSGRHVEGLDAYLDTVRGHRPDDSSLWNLEDLSFWEDSYTNAEQTRLSLERVERSRPDAGDRAFPREKHLFSQLRRTIASKRVLDIGCGYAQTVRTLLPPDELDYHYIGADLALGALRANMRSMPGDFIQCSADALPFRAEAVDVALSLGTLHHVHDPLAALDALLDVVKPNGFIALHEVVRRGGRESDRISKRESAHNEAIDADATLQCIERRCEIIEMKFEYSPIRGLVAHHLSDAMRTSPRLTRAVIAVDNVILNTVGRVSATLGGHGLLVLARKRP